MHQGPPTKMEQSHLETRRVRRNCEGEQAAGEQNRESKEGREGDADQQQGDLRPTRPAGGGLANGEENCRCGHRADHLPDREPWQRLLR